MSVAKENIKKIIADTECDINVDDDGIVTAASLDLQRCKDAIEVIRSMTMEPEQGMEFDGRITRLMTCLVSILLMGCLSSSF